MSGSARASSDGDASIEPRHSDSADRIAAALRRAPTGTVWFFLPCDVAAFDRLPKSTAEYWQWQSQDSDLVPHWGRYHWVLQTYLNLREAGYPVELARELPDQGVVISHVDCFDYGLRVDKRRFVVALLVDRPVPSPCASLHVTHNPAQGLQMGLAARYIPPWPQVALKTRLASRGDVFNTVAFFGYRNNLHSALATGRFAQRLAHLGVQLIIPEPSAWNDFSDVDAIIAVRGFGRSNPHLNKPSLKLYNAWLAHVPSVLGYEVAYRHEGRPGAGYLEATSEDEAYEAIARLANDRDVRQSVVETGAQLAANFTESVTCARWIDFLDAEVLPSYRRWISSPTTVWAHRITATVKERLLWRMQGSFVDISTRR